jgi:Zn finger protein HypA/HybF involved in hydrogenase expression
MEIKVKTLKCKRCGHEWIPRKADVRLCPHCKTAYWDVEREVKEEESTND